MGREPLHDLTEQKEKAILVLLPEPREEWQEEDVYQELAELSDTAGLEVVDHLIQHRSAPDAAYYLGKGKLEELRQLCLAREADCVIFAHSLSPSQLYNLGKVLDTKVLDKTMLILDIFAQRARSREGKLQVELAQANYLLPRLLGQGMNLSRQGGGAKKGGVGTRGPGETQLETDRRYIRGRLNYLEDRLKELEKRRSLLSERRKKDDVKTIALVGYTNTGKSTLMNLLTGADVYVKNELFATLDPTARKFSIDDVEFLLIDTVGFLQELPHKLIEAFHSTLESALHCDLALIVCDATGEYEMQQATTLQTLEELGFSGKTLLVMNKTEGLTDTTSLPRDSVAISAKTGKGIETLKREILKEFASDFFFCELFVPYAQMNEYAKIKPLLKERTSQFHDDGIFVSVVVPARYAEKCTPYLVKRQ